MKNDSRTGWRVVLKTGSGYQVYEESIALLSELSMLGHTNPGKKGKGKEKKQFCVCEPYFCHYISHTRFKVCVQNVWAL